MRFVIDIHPRQAPLDVEGFLDSLNTDCENDGLDIIHRVQLISTMGSVLSYNDMASKIKYIKILAYESDRKKPEDKWFTIEVKFIANNMSYWLNVENFQNGGLMLKIHIPSLPRCRWSDCFDSYDKFSVSLDRAMELLHGVSSVQYTGMQVPYRLLKGKAIFK